MVSLCDNTFPVFARAGEMIAKQPGRDLIDGAPFVTGILTLLKQFHSENTDSFLALTGQYVRSLVDATQT